jgi:hypothetical protein
MLTPVRNTLIRVGRTKCYMPKTRRIIVRLTDEEYDVIRKLRVMGGFQSDSETIRLSVNVVYILLRAGVFNLLKPMPELVKLISENGD